MVMKVHHQTAKKAAKLGIVIRAEQDDFIAVDTRGDPAREFGGLNAAKLLDEDLAARAANGAATTVDGDRYPAHAEPAPAITCAPMHGEPPEAAEPATEPPEAASPAGRSVVKAAFRERYAQHGGSCGDAVAQALNTTCRNAKGGLDLAALVRIGNANSIDVLGRWPAVNPGQKRMLLSVVLRAMLRKGQTVQIGDIAIEPGGAS
jgi:hypothetical protein